jgi:hypothetical protein
MPNANGNSSECTRARAPAVAKHPDLGARPVVAHDCLVRLCAPRAHTGRQRTVQEVLRAAGVTGRRDAVKVEDLRICSFIKDPIRQLLRLQFRLVALTVAARGLDAGEAVGEDLRVAHRSGGLAGPSAVAADDDVCRAQARQHVLSLVLSAVNLQGLPALRKLEFTCARACGLRQMT